MLNPQEVLNDDGWLKYISHLANIIYAAKWFDENGEALGMDEKELGLIEDASILANELIEQELFEE